MFGFALTVQRPGRTQEVLCIPGWYDYVVAYGALGFDESYLFFPHSAEAGVIYFEEQ